MNLTVVEQEGVRYFLVLGRPIHDLKQAEALLRKSESTFRAIIDGSPVLFALNDDKQNMTYLNAEFTRTFGYDIDDVPTRQRMFSRFSPCPNERTGVRGSFIRFM